MLTLLFSLQAPVEAMIRQAVESGPGAVLIVPENISHESERKLCIIGGDSICLRAEVLSFPRLAQRVISLNPEIRGRKRLDAAGRLLLMRQTTEELRSRVKFFASALNREQFLEELLGAVDELKSCRVSAQQLSAAAGQLQGVQAQKLEELGLILETYNALCSGNAYDPKDALDQLADCLIEDDYADTHSFFLGGFEHFTAQELLVIEAMLRRGAEVTVSLSCDDPNRGSNALEAVRGTVRQLQKIASRVGVKSRFLQKDAAFYPVQEFLLSHLFQGGSEVFSGNGDGLVLVQPADTQSECRTAAQEIRRLHQEGTRFRQIGIALCSAQTQLPVLRRCLSAMDLPYYCVGRRSSSERPLFALVLHALDCVSYGFRREEVIACLRTGLFGFREDETDLLENYAIAWDIRGNRWLSPFTAHPDGYDAQMDDRSQERLAQINALRIRAAEPLRRLQNALRSAEQLPDQVRALYEFLEGLNLREQIGQGVERLQNAGWLQRANEEAQLYSILITALEQLHTQAGAAKSLTHFYRLVELLLKQYDVATIPPVLDSIMIGSYEDLRGRQFDCLFLLGAEDGAFPAFQRTGSLISEEERHTLRNLGISLPGTEERLDWGSAAIFTLLAGAGRKIYVSCPQDVQPAYLFSCFCRQFPMCVREAEKTDLPENLRLLAARSLGSGVPLPEQMAQNERIRTDLEELRHSLSYTPGELTQEAVRAIYGQTLSLSPSRLDLLGKCRFAYYLEYGLRLEKRETFRFDAPIFGTFVHAVLEDTVREVEQLGGFSMVDDEQVYRFAEESIARFAQTHFQGTEGERFVYLFNRHRLEIQDILESLSDEMRKSDFHARAFELRFAPNGDLPPISVEGAAVPARIVGVVDRADTANIAGRDYMRIVDYKTGTKELDYTDITIGEGLQMLIYLSALEKLGIPDVGSRLHPAGVLYFPAKERILSRPNREPEEVVDQERKKKGRRSGLILDNETVLEAMEHGDPEYLPYSRLKDGTRKGDLADPDQFRLLGRFVDSLLRERVNELASGQTKPNPYSRGSRPGSCDWCNYQHVCRFASSGEEKRSYKKMKAEAFWEELSKEERDGKL